PRSDDPVLAPTANPAGVAAHPRPGWDGPTVVGPLTAAGVHLARAGAAEREGIVHRLDAGTSGLMIVAKSDSASSVLKRAFKERTVSRRYHALVHGHLTQPAGTLAAPHDRPLGRPS